MAWESHAGLSVYKNVNGAAMGLKRPGDILVGVDGYHSFRDTAVEYGLGAGDQVLEIDGVGLVLGVQRRENLGRRPLLSVRLCFSDTMSEAA